MRRILVRKLGYLVKGLRFDTDNSLGQQTKGLYSLFASPLHEPLRGVHAITERASTHVRV